MRAAFVLALLVGCVTPAATFVCETSADCSGGTCEADGFCSFADATCDSGRRYGEASGSLSGQCVGGSSGDVCGDMMVTGAEECEDGNNVGTDFCVDCKFAKCGDGQIQAGVEDCDDGNTADGDTCLSNCLTCPAGAVVNPDNNHCYWLVETAANWNAAAAACTASGGYMATISDAAENTFVTNLLVNAQYWIGLEESFFGGGPRDFRWEDDSRLAMGFQSWVPTTEPSTGVDDECVGMIKASGNWDAQICTTLLPSVCEREAPIVDRAGKRVFRRFPGEQQRTYDAAKAICAALDPPGHLPTIADQAEQDFINSLMDSTRMWIGLDDVAVEGTFAWVTGEATGYFNWNPAGFNGQEPDPVNGATEDFAGMREDGTWETQNAGDDNNFMCEIDLGP